MLNESKIYSIRFGNLILDESPREAETGRGRRRDEYVRRQLFLMRRTFLFLTVCLLAVPSSANITTCYSETNQFTGRYTGVKEQCSGALHCYNMVGKSPYDRKPTRGCGTPLIDDLCTKYKKNEVEANFWCFSVDDSGYEGRLCCCTGPNCNFCGKETIFSGLRSREARLVAAGGSKLVIHRSFHMIVVPIFVSFLTLSALSSSYPLRETNDLLDTVDDEPSDMPTEPPLLDDDPKHHLKQKPTYDKATIRTLSIIHYKGTENRLVLLICRNQCVRQRSLVPRWLREFSNENNSTREDPIFFHYHLLKRARLPIYLLDAKNPSVYYFVGGTYFAFQGDLSNKDHFMNWLQTREDTKSTNIQSWSGLENVLLENTGCNDDNQLLMVNSPEHCPYDYWTNLARSLNDQSNLSLYEIQRPFNVEIEIVLQQRFPRLSDDCLQMILVSDNAYTELPILDNVAEMRASILSQMNRGCMPPRDPWRTVDIPLNEIQLEYYSRDNLLRTNEMKPHFIVVGAIAGVSVVALAISIFWGLNGTAFTQK
uniref:NPC1_N domain-containing protein n=1 Tax=Steinernema glaseri TaxID=37863 RepID=A0A1I7XX20_9BILA